MERSLSVERTLDGKIVARQNPNYKEGRPKSHSDKKLVEAMRMKEKMGYSFRQLSDATGISMSTLQRFARKQRDQQEASAE